LKDDEVDYDKAIKLAEMIQRAIADITDAVSYNIDEEDDYSKLATYSALVTVTGYFEFKLRQDGFKTSEIDVTKTGAEKYVVSMITEELEAIPQKKGDA
jgi:hypothetical protein